MSIIGQEYTCSSCGKHFRFQSEAEEFETTHGYEEPVKCPACNAVVRQKRGSGRDEGQSHLHYGMCPKCNSQTQVYSLQNGTHTTLCPECSRAYSSSSY